MQTGMPPFLLSSFRAPWLVVKALRLLVALPWLAVFRHRVKNKISTVGKWLAVFRHRVKNEISATGKSAMEYLVRCYALKLAQRGINVNAGASPQDRWTDGFGDHACHHRFLVLQHCGGFSENAGALFDERKGSKT
jgi:NAD(P)-dependent dehydrogenase (short-subunit alcohol dehydrogenase family)